MKHNKASKSRLPTIIFPTVKIPQPDGGLLLKPGKPTEVSELIGTAEAAKELGLSPRQLTRLFESGSFRTATKPGGCVRSNWRVERAEIEERRTMRYDHGPARYTRA